MKPVNLIPARRVIARQRQRHVRRSVVICASWALVVTGVCAAGQGLVPAGVGGQGGGEALPAKLERAARDIETHQQTLTIAREELAAAQATLRATRSIADQPDWSALLALIGKATGDDVMLRSFELQPLVSPGNPGASAQRPGGKPTPLAGAAAAPQSKSPAAGGGFVLNASGLAQSQFAVTQFVLRLERVGLFSKVTLLDTGREPFRDGEATSFRVECVIDANAAAPSSAAAPPVAAKQQPGGKRQ